MKLTIAGSLGNISKPLAMKLVKEGHEVTVISSHPERAADIEALGAKAAIGSVSDAGFLTKAFEGADAVYTMTPPNLGGANVIANTAAAGQAFADAIRAAGVRRVVMLSSIGADHPSGNGPVAGLHRIEEIYRTLEGLSVTFVRAGYFYTNLYHDIPVIKGMNIMGNNFPAETLIPLVHPVDIAEAVAGELTSVSSGVRYVVSDLRSAGDVAVALGNAVGKQGLPWVQFTDDQLKQGMLGAGMPEEIANLYIEMGNGFTKGLMGKHFADSGSPVTGSIKLEQFAAEFAARF